MKKEEEEAEERRADKNDMMKNFLLLVFSLITAVQMDHDLEGCRGGWIQFTCKYPETHETYQSISVLKDEKKKIQSKKKDEWEQKKQIYLYHDTRNKELKVTIKELQEEDFEKYRCGFNQQLTEELQVEEAGSCQVSVSLTAYRSAQTSISCDSTENTEMFFCRDDGPNCEDISSNETFTVSGSSMSIRNVSSQHAGVYWCGLGAAGGSHRAALRRVTLEVKGISNFSRSPAAGQNLTYWCRSIKNNRRTFVCKGEDPSRCETVVTSSRSQRHNRKFIMEEDREKTRFNITVINVTAEDSGTYWCGAETSETPGRNQFFHRFTMTVTPPPAVDTPLLLPVVVVCVSVFLILIIFIFFIFVYKRRSKRKRNAAQQKEDFIYQEIPGPEPPSASLHYCTVTFHRPPGVKPDITSSSCEYSAVRNQSTGGRPGPEDP